MTNDAYQAKYHTVKSGTYVPDFVVINDKTFIFFKKIVTY